MDRKKIIVVFLVLLIGIGTYLFLGEGFGLQGRMGRDLAKPKPQSSKKIETVPSVVDTGFGDLQALANSVPPEAPKDLIVSQQGGCGENIIITWVDPTYKDYTTQLQKHRIKWCDSQGCNEHDLDITETQFNHEKHQFELVYNEPDSVTFSVSGNDGKLWSKVSKKTLNVLQCKPPVYTKAVFGYSFATGDQVNIPEGTYVIRLLLPKVTSDAKDLKEMLNQKCLYDEQGNPCPYEPITYYYYPYLGNNSDYSLVSGEDEFLQAAGLKFGNTYEWTYWAENAVGKSNEVKFEYYYPSSAAPGAY